MNSKYRLYKILAVDRFTLNPFIISKFTIFWYGNPETMDNLLCQGPASWAYASDSHDHGLCIWTRNIRFLQ